MRYLLNEIRKYESLRDSGNITMEQEVLFNRLVEAAENYEEQTNELGHTTIIENEFYKLIFTKGGTYSRVDKILNFTFWLDAKQLQDFLINAKSL